MPATRPRQPAFQSEAAVVSPAIFFCAMKMVPAPRKPIPLITWALMRPSVTVTPLLACARFRASASSARYRSMTAMSAAPTQTNTCVRMPAGLFFRSRSTPITQPIAVANSSLSPASHHSTRTPPRYASQARSLSASSA
jgi:hypothetical protein